MGAFHQVGQRRVERCRKVKYTLNETPPFSHLDGLYFKTMGIKAT